MSESNANIEPPDGKEGLNAGAFGRGRTVIEAMFTTALLMVKQGEQNRTVETEGEF